MFDTVEFVERMIRESAIVQSQDSNYEWLNLLLEYERRLDRERTELFVQQSSSSPQFKEFRFRERMARHNISKIALQMDKSVTDRITGKADEQKSFLAGCIRDRVEYPAPVAT